jgi:hypothetical protein
MAHDAMHNTGKFGDCGYERAGPTAGDSLTRFPKCGSANQNIAVSLRE